MARERGSASKEYDVLTLEALNAALDINAWRDLWGEDARAAWQAFKERVPFNPTHPPMIYWIYEDVPAELRGTGTLADYDNRELKAGRRRWLADRND